MSLDLAAFAEGTDLRIITCTLDDKIDPAARRIRAVAFAVSNCSAIDDEEAKQVCEMLHDLADGIVEQVEYASQALRRLVAIEQEAQPKRKAVAV